MLWVQVVVHAVANDKDHVALVAWVVKCLEIAEVRFALFSYKPML